MYINVGGGRVLRSRDVIGIFDMDTATVSRNTKLYLRRQEMNGTLEYVSNDLPRSFIVTADGCVTVCDLNPKTVCARTSRKERKNNG